jgi:hypothetical protein
LLSQTLLPADTSITDIEYGSARTANKAGIPDTSSGYRSERGRYAHSMCHKGSWSTLINCDDVSTKNKFFLIRIIITDYQRNGFSSDLRNETDQAEAA